jgi:uncharacterized repeat protein (TIGR03803 family)
MNPNERLGLANRLFAIVLIILMVTAAASAAWKEKVLYSFQSGNDGYTPAGGVVFDKAGNLYGVNSWGGSGCPSPGCGTVYQLSPPVQKGGAWTETIIHAFQGLPANDGYTPEGGLIIDSLGNLYGTTSMGGNGPCVLLGSLAGCGIVYELSPPTGGQWTYAVLYNFQGNNDGYFPSGNLTFDKAGNLYGATEFGGGKGYDNCNKFYGYCGTIFELSPPKQKGGAWMERVLHKFAGGSDGTNPNGGLIFGGAGSIYGTTYFGGNESGECNGGVGGIGCGTVFKLVPPTRKGGAWKEKVLHRFNGRDGDNPAARVVFGGNGDLYCTTFGGGGGNFPSGAIVQLVPHSNGPWTEHMLHSFQDGADGGEPRGGVVFDAGGNLYGTATGGGAVGNGTLFQLRRTGKSWTFTAAYSFTVSPDGAYPAGDLIFDRAGNLYGTTQRGGSGQACGNYGCGTVFEIKP